MKNDTSFVGRPMFYVTIVAIVCILVPLLGLVIQHVSNPYSRGGAEFNPADIHSIVIEWEQGDVQIKTSDSPNIKLSENDNIMDDHRLIYRIHDKVLTVRYQLPKLLQFISGEAESKNLLLELPSDWNCENITISESGNSVTVNDLTAKSFKINGKNCNFTFNNCAFQNLSTYSQTLNCEIQYSGELNTMDLNVISTNFNGEFTNTPSVFNIYFGIANGVQGKFNITIPSDSGFITDKLTNVNSDFLLQRQYEESDSTSTKIFTHLYYGDKSLKINVNERSSFKLFGIHSDQYLA